MNTMGMITPREYHIREFDKLFNRFPKEKELCIAFQIRRNIYEEDDHYECVDSAWDVRLKNVRMDGEFYEYVYDNAIVDNCLINTFLYDVVEEDFGKIVKENEEYFDVNVELWLRKEKDGIYYKIGYDKRYINEKEEIDIYSEETDWMKI